MSINIRSLSTAITLSFVAGAAFADPPNDGHLDSAWDGNGKAFVAFDFGGQGNNLDTARSAAVAADGSLYLGGRALNGNGVGVIAIAKRDPLGAPDNSFSGDGKTAVLTLVDTPVEAVKIALSNDGGYIYAAATARISPTDTDIVVCRLDAASGENSSFESPNNALVGCTRTPLTEGRQAAADIVVQPDGKFVVVGTTASSGFPGATYAYAARFNADGSLDDGFTDDPIRNGEFFAVHDVRAAALASNGKIVIVGVTVRVNATAPDGLVIRLNSDGTQDALGAESEQAYSLDGSEDRRTEFSDVTLERRAPGEEDGILIGGLAQPQANAGYPVIAHLTQVGGVLGLNVDFNTTGYFIVSSPANEGRIFRAVAVHPCAGYIAVTNGASAGDANIRAYAFNRAGSSNVQFGTDSITTIDMFANNTIETAYDAVVAGDGVYIVGDGIQTSFPPPNRQFVAAKLFMDSVYCDGFQQ